MGKVNNMECPFCFRFSNLDYMGYDDEVNVIWFEPLNPVTEGHMLFVPTWHVEHWEDSAPQWVGAAFEAASRFVQQRTNYTAFNLITSFGHASTQTVPHVHIHLVPRREGDGLQLPWGLPHD